MKDISKPLLAWYKTAKRNLPWRQDTNPYHVWVSEIMLQQTRIEAVIEYYNRFMDKLPTISDLSSIDLDTLLKLWEGLGYYTRAHNLQKAAQKIMNEYDGIFPRKYEDIISLPGIGEYTASAIASICFSLKQVTIDGNVLRVYSRLCNCYDDISLVSTKKKVRQELEKIIPNNSGDFNQAMMELGETICIPNGAPKCTCCPLSSHCLAYEQNTFQHLPVKTQKKNRKMEQYTVFLLYTKNKVAVLKRETPGLLRNLWQCPNVEGHLTMDKALDSLQKMKIFPQDIVEGPTYKHVFTHKEWEMISYIVKVKEENSPYTWVMKKDLDSIIAIPTAFQPFKKKIIEVIESPA